MFIAFSDPVGYFYWLVDKTVCLHKTVALDIRFHLSKQKTIINYFGIRTDTHTKFRVSYELVHSSVYISEYWHYLHRHQLS